MNVSVEQFFLKKKRLKKDESKEIFSILIYVGGDLLGDALLKVPFLRGLRQCFPNAKITWLAGQTTTVFSDILREMVRYEIDEVLNNAQIGVSIGEVLRSPLPGRHFDLIIDTQKGFFTTLAVKRISHSVFISPTMNFFFSAAKPKRPFPINLQQQLFDLLELVTGVAVENSDIRLDVAKPLKEDAIKLLPDGPCYIGLAPGAGGRHKRWPLEHFVELARLLVLEGKVPVFFLGPGESDMCEVIQTLISEVLFPLQDDVINHAFDPAFTLALARRCQMNITNDAGVGHICSLSGRPQLILFGPTSSAKFLPIVGDVHVLKAQDFGGRDMTLIPVKAVFKKMSDLSFG
jgi:ADP-heptose:LPS heptosyltransferase